MKTYLEQRREKVLEAKEVKKKKGIAKRSKKMTDQMKIYNRERIEFLKLNPLCVVTGKKATQVHHAKGRVGKLLLDKRYWKAVSDEGHRKIELNPNWAKENGFSISRLAK